MTGPGEVNMVRQREVMAAIAEARKAAGMTPEDLAKRAGVSISTLYAYAANTRNPGLSNILALADSVGLEIVMRVKP